MSGFIPTFFERASVRHDYSGHGDEEGGGGVSRVGVGGEVAIADTTQTFTKMLTLSLNTLL